MRRREKVIDSVQRYKYIRYIILTNSVLQLNFDDCRDFLIRSYLKNKKQKRKKKYYHRIQRKNAFIIFDILLRLQK